MSKDPWPFPLGDKPSSYTDAVKKVNDYYNDLPKIDPSMISKKPATQHLTIDLTALAKEISDSMGIFPGTGETDPSGKPLNAPGAKADAGKTLPWLFETGFANALWEVARITTLGARKYTPNGWAAVDNGVERYMEAFARHKAYLAKGEVFDDGPGGLGPDIYHKASMIWNLLASLELELRENNSTNPS